MDGLRLRPNLELYMDNVKVKTLYQCAQDALAVIAPEIQFIIPEYGKWIEL